MALLLTAMISSVIVRICIDLRFDPLRVEDSPAADTVMFGVLAVCGSLLAALAVLQCVLFLVSPEQRAKVRSLKTILVTMIMMLNMTKTKTMTILLSR